MSKFKVGDKVIRVQDRGGLIPVGAVVTVRGVGNLEGLGNTIFVTDYKGGYDAGNFEHYVEQTAVGSDAVLTPLEVFEHILAGTPLEYSPKANAHPEWFSLTNPKYVNLGTIEQCDFRIEPQNMKVNGIDVPKPLDTADIRYSDKVYGINLSRQTVFYVTGHITKGHFWATEEDAQAVLDAILTSFSK